jgi:hypothetical protein
MKKIGHLELTVIVLVPDEEGMVRHLPQVHQHPDGGLTLLLTLLQLYTTKLACFSLQKHHTVPAVQMFLKG